MQHHQFVPMWVMNVTPDSFSDGGHWQKNQLRWIESIKQFSPKVIIDVGAESTAPGRLPISARVEIERLDQYFFSKLNQLPISMNLSIDTYKLETIKWCLEKIKNFAQVASVYWNDVSAQYQDGVVELLKANPKLKYILCHNRVHSRDDVLNHVKYAKEAENHLIAEQVKDFFSSGLSYFQKNNCEDRVILDPAFGFAKSREENWLLVDKLPWLFSTFSRHDFLVGISRKSFLREVGKSYQDQNQGERCIAQEGIILGKLLNTHIRQKILWRTHHESLVELLK